MNWKKLILPIVGLAVVAIAVVAVVSLFTRKPVDITRGVSRDFTRYHEGRLELEQKTDDRLSLEKFFTGRKVPFPARIIDFGEMGYRLMGGRINHGGRHPTTMLAYEGPAKQAVICEMFDRLLSDLPEEAEIRENNGITFRIYERGGVTLVFWQEGGVLFVLASDIPRGNLTQLAFARAEKG